MFMDRFYSTKEIVVYIFLMLLLIFESSAALAESKMDSVKLSFKVSPEKIKSEAKKGRFLPIPVFSNPVSIRTFFASVVKAKKENRAVFFIGVVVDAENKEWPSDATTAHIRAVHKKMIKILSGRRKENIVGFAEKYGVRVASIVPIIYKPNQRFRQKLKGNNVAVNIELDSILIAMNDHIIPTQKNGKLIKKIDQLQLYIEEYLKEGLHLISKIEFYDQLVKYNAGLKASIEVLELDNIEGLLVLTYVDSGTFSKRTAEGRANRKKVEKFFDKYKLTMNKNRYNIDAMFSKIERIGIKITKRACDLGDALGCNFLAFSYEQGKGVKKNIIRARQLFRKACKAGSKVACKKQ